MSSVASRAVRKMIGHARALGAEPLGDVEALHVGQHHVEHHQVRAEVGDRAERVRPGPGRLDGEALEAQGHGHDVDDVGLIVDDEHAVVAAVAVSVVHAIQSHRGFLGGS